MNYRIKTKWFSLFFGLVSTLLFLGINPTLASDYYISSVDSSASDSNSGTSTSSPWISLSKINEFSLSPGDNIYLEEGSVFSGQQVLIDDDGTSSERISINSYNNGHGTGKPTIDGENTLTYGIKITGSYVTVENIKIININTVDSNDFSPCNENKYDGAIWIYGSGRLYALIEGYNLCYSAVDDVNPVTGVEIKNTDLLNVEKAITITDANETLIEGCNITNDNPTNAVSGITIDNSTGNVIRDCDISKIKGSGISCSIGWLWPAVIDGKTYNLWWVCDDNLFEYNEISYTQIGINVSGQSITQYNIIHDNGYEDTGGTNSIGIEHLYAGNSISRYNVVYNMNQIDDDYYEAVGIYIDDGSNGSMAYGNICFDNEGPGIMTNNATNVKVFNNVLYHNSQKVGTYREGGGLRIFPLKTNDETELRKKLGDYFNNIIMDDGYAEVSTYATKNGIPLNYSIFNNIYYNSDSPDGSGRFVSNDVVPGGCYSECSGRVDFDEWVTLKTDTESIFQNPIFADPENYQFQLQAGSPAINAGSTNPSVGYVGLLKPETFILENGLVNRDILQQISNQVFEIGAYGYDLIVPDITSITSSNEDKTYDSEDSLEIIFNFSEPVTSEGIVTVTFSTSQTCSFSVSDSITATCTYDVGENDESNDLDVINISGNIEDQTGNAMVSFTPVTNLAQNKDLKLFTPNELKIKNIKSLSTSNSIIIEWETNNKADSQVRYGEDKNLKKEKDDNEEEKKHKLTIKDLKPDTLYYFKIKSTDEYEQEETSKIYSIKTKTADVSNSLNLVPNYQNLSFGFSGNNQNQETSSGLKTSEDKSSLIPENLKAEIQKEKANQNNKNLISQPRTETNYWKYILTGTFSIITIGALGFLVKLMVKI